MHGAAAIRWWWVLVVTVAGGAVGLGINALPGFTGDELDIPVWVWVLVAAAGIPISQFLAFHDVRTGRDTEIEKLRAELAIPNSLADLLLVEPERRSRELSGETGRVAVDEYLSIKFSNRSDREIANCKMRLESLYYLVPESGRWVGKEKFSPLLLSWSFNDGGGPEMTIAARSNRTCDLVAYEGEGAEEAIIIAAEGTLRGADKLRFGRWRARCHIEAE